MGKERLDSGRGRGQKGVVKGGSQVVRKTDGGKRGFYILLAILLIAGITALSYMASRPKATVVAVDTTLPPVPNQGHVLGSDSAPVEVVEFADFECPACGSFATLTEPDVRSRLVDKGLIRYRFMDFPLNMHRNTWSAHRAAWCAADQNKFWEMHDVLFQNQDRWNGEATSRPDKPIADLAKQLGLEMSKFNACVSARKYDPQIRANISEGVKRQVNATPSFLFGNKLVQNAISYDEFKRHVDTALSAARPPAKTK